MTQICYIALLRGINVGRAKRIAMADLRKLVQDLGFSKVRSLLNSGNLVFWGRAAAPEEVAAQIEETLVLKLGVASRVTVLPLDQLNAIVADNTLVSQASDPSRLLVFIACQQASRALVAPLAEQDWAPEALALGRYAAYAWCPAGVLASRAAQVLSKLLGEDTTARNWSTISKLHALALTE